MSTPTPDEPPHAHHLPPRPEREHDMLGPLGAKAAAFHDPAALRAMLVGEFESAVQAAREAAGKAEQDHAEAVHASRKALRKARAVLGLVAGALPKSERNAIKRALQQARRALSTIRDHAVAPITIAALPLGEEDRATANRVLENAHSAMPPTAEIKQLLGESAARAAAQAEALQAGLTHDLDRDVVFDGVRAVYADARRARASAKGSKSWFHAWRRRSKELVYQLDMLAAHAGARSKAIHDEIDAITDQLSAAVDLIMVRDFVATHAQGIAPDALEHLRTAIDAQLGDLIKTARKAGRDTFAAGGKKFEKRLAKAVKRDLTPPDDIATNGHTEDEE